MIDGTAPIMNWPIIPTIAKAQQMNKLVMASPLILVGIIGAIA